MTFHVTIGTTFPSRMATRRLAARIGAKVRSLRSDERGVAGIEFALIAPLLLGLLLGGVTLFDIYRYAERTEATTYTVADLISRSRVLEKNDMADLHATHVALLGTPADKTRTRVSSVFKKEIKAKGKGKGKSKGKGKGKGKKDPVEFEYVVRWTYDSDRPDSCKPAKNVPLDIIPDIAINDSVLIVETGARKMLFSDMLTTSQEKLYLNQVAIRPRYVPEINLLKC